MQFFKRIQRSCHLCPTYFLPTAAQSKQKMPLAGNALHPIIRQILQVVCTCSRQAEAALNKLNRLPWRLPCKIHLIIGEP
jgi:hypothetical protein